VSLQEDQENNNINNLTSNKVLQEQMQLENTKINYVKLGQLLTELGFLPLNLTPDSVERELLFDLWNILKGEDKEGISLLNLKRVLLVVQGLKKQDYREDKSNKDKQ
jgi:hypothetical protein